MNEKGIKTSISIMSGEKEPHAEKKWMARVWGLEAWPLIFSKRFSKWHQLFSSFYGYIFISVKGIQGVKHNF